MANPATPAHPVRISFDSALEIKKHVGAIHIEGKLSLLDRKVANVLLLNAYEQLPDPSTDVHTIRLRTLADISGFDSKDIDHLKHSLQTLANTTVRWNILDEKGDEEWGVAAFISQAVIRDGVCNYAYAPEMRRRFYQPEVYARINLSVQERFGSGYALALYENCVRFRSVSSTGWRTIDTWRALLGIEPGQYESFKYFNRDVLKPAVAEVNKSSDIRVVMERKRSGKRITALKFDISENPQLRLDMGDAKRRAEEARAKGEFSSDIPDPRALTPDAMAVLTPLQRRLVTFGLTESQAVDVSTGFGPARVLRNLHFVERELLIGRAIKNVAAYTLSAIRTDYAAGGEAPVEAEIAEKKAKLNSVRSATRQRGQTTLAEAQRAEADEERRRDERRSRLEAVWEGLSADQRSVIDSAVLSRLKTDIPHLYVRHLADGENATVGVRLTVASFRYDAIEALEARGPGA